MKVAVVIPAYNVEEYIFRALDSCVSQTYSNIEIIVIDDGSTDHTYDIAKSYSERDSRVKIYKQRNSGVSAARNHALKLCKADFVLFLDSDDWLELNAIELLLENLPKDGNDYLIASDAYFAYMDKKGEIIKEAAPNIAHHIETHSEDALLFMTRKQYKMRSACYKMFSVEVIKENRLNFDNDIKYGEDGLFVFEYLKHADSFIYFPALLWNILERQGSATQSPYNKSWLTSIDAVEKMLQYENNIKLDKELKNYKVQRMVSVLCAAIIDLDNMKSDVNLLRNKLRKEFNRYMIEEKSIKNKMFYLFATYVPKILLKRYCIKK